jgi:glycosyltransferase involved in cell wall biosynthesis
MNESALNPVSAELSYQNSWLAEPVRITEQVWPEGTVPVVSICSITYNHEKFIRECLDGFLMQETTFPVEVLIHDDASTDGTANIIREYEAKYPHIIKPIYQVENQYSKGFKVNTTFNFPRVKGKYVALCEGDDYWTASNKLQKQVDFMESNLTYSICFHNVESFYEDCSTSSHPMFIKPLKDTLTIRDLVTSNFIPTLSNLFRAKLFNNFPEWFMCMPFGDWPLNILNAEHGNIGYIDQIFGVYRIHNNGVWSKLSKVDAYKKNIIVAEAINAHLNFKYTQEIEERVAYWHYQIASEMSREGLKDGIIKHLFESLRHKNEKIPKSDVYRLIFKHTAPSLYFRIYWRWQRIREIIRASR